MMLKKRLGSENKNWKTQVVISSSEKSEYTVKHSELISERKALFIFSRLSQSVHVTKKGPCSDLQALGMKYYLAPLPAL